MYTRITPEIKKIADAHINARLKNRFSDPIVKDKNELFTMLKHGETFNKLLEKIEIQYCSVTAIILSNSMFSYPSKNYVSAIYRGFKDLFNAHENV